MNKMKRRARLCILLAMVLVLGLGLYLVRLWNDGGKWVSYPGNGDVYTQGYISKGTIYDRNGTLLLQNTDSGVPVYNDSYEIRTATVHAVGDAVGNIPTGANYKYADRLVGYNFLWGTFSTNNKGRNLYLTLDAYICQVANQAMAGRNGVVGVYNYKTGEIICMVSTPNYDPVNPPAVADQGMYLNKFLSSTFVPGSTFKVVTATAALENVDNIENWSYTCPYIRDFGPTENDRVVCMYDHGTVDLKDALAKSCNNAFGELSIMMGPSTLKKYTELAGLTSRYDIDGIVTAKGTFEFPRQDVTLAWTGIGQNQDLVNPCAMMVYMGTIANGGVRVDPHLVDSVRFDNGWDASFPIRVHSEEVLKPETAAKLDEMLHYDVTSNYGEARFPGLDICAKSGTAETGEGAPHAWFYGYIRNPGYPYAFVVLIENGGFGSDQAGDVANQVMQAVISLPAAEE